MVTHYLKKYTLLLTINLQSYRVLKSICLYREYLGWLKVWRWILHRLLELLQTYTFVYICVLLSNHFVGTIDIYLL